jgi:2-keto-myo-inositol isomerase
MEPAGDDMRVMPGEGILPLEQILSTAEEIGYEGYVSLELFSKEIWEMDVFEAAQLGYEKSSVLLDRFE